MLIENTSLNADALEAMLDADPSDQVTRLILADLMEEHGDSVYANGLRWIAENERNPRLDNKWYWYWLGSNPSWKSTPQGIPGYIYRNDDHTPYRMHCGSYPTRQAAERDLANAVHEALK